MQARFTGLAPCVATTPLSGVLGAAIDERLHGSLSLWLGLCRRGSLPYFEALWLQLQLMPCALIFMLATALLGTLWALMCSGRPAGARVLLAGHAGCAVATLASPALCPRLLAGGPSAPLALADMLAFELLLTMAVAWALLVVATGRRRPART